MDETRDEQLARVASMASGSTTWDHTEKDTAAIKRVFEENQSMDRVMQRIADAAGFQGQPGDVSGLLDCVRSQRPESN